MSQTSFYTGRPEVPSSLSARNREQALEHSPPAEPRGEVATGAWTVFQLIHLPFQLIVLGRLLFEERDRFLLRRLDALAPGKFGEHQVDLQPSLGVPPVAVPPLVDA